MRVIFLILALAAPARAEVDFHRDEHAREDLALISACFDAAQTWEAALDCVNLTFEPCIERLGRKAAHVDQAACSSRELDLWDHLLAIETRKVEAWVILKDNDIAAKSVRAPFAHQTFLEAQEDWTTYREAQCVFEVQQVSGGTAGMTVRPHCEMDLVVDRLFTLRTVLGGIEDVVSP